MQKQFSSQEANKEGKKTPKPLKQNQPKMHTIELTILSNKEKSWKKKSLCEPLLTFHLEFFDVKQNLYFNILSDLKHYINNEDI